MTYLDIENIYIPETISRKDILKLLGPIRYQIFEKSLSKRTLRRWTSAIGLQDKQVFTKSQTEQLCAIAIYLSKGLTWRQVMIELGIEKNKEKTNDSSERSEDYSSYTPGTNPFDGKSKWSNFWSSAS